MKFVYGVYINVLDFLNKEIKEGRFEKYQHCAIILLYYLYDQSIVCQFLLTKQPNLRIKLSQLYWSCKKKAQELDLKEFSQGLFSFEKDLVGFKLYQIAFDKLKTGYGLEVEESGAAIY